MSNFIKLIISTYVTYILRILKIGHVLFWSMINFARPYHVQWRIFMHFVITTLHVHKWIMIRPEAICHRPSLILLCKWLQCWKKTVMSLHIIFGTVNNWTHLEYFLHKKYLTLLSGNLVWIVTVILFAEDCISGEGKFFK